jgi:hypothetical protein
MHPDAPEIYCNARDLGEPMLQQQTSNANALHLSSIVVKNAHFTTEIKK